MSRPAGAPGTASANYRVTEPDAAFAERLAVWEAAEADEAGTVERVAGAIFQAMHGSGWWSTQAESSKAEYRRLAQAAITALKPSPGVPDPAAGGVALIAAERQRQIDAEGWTPEHDAQHAGESLAIAACCYALPPQMRKWRRTGAGLVPTLWPWAPGYWKPRADDRVRELVKAGALIAAEIDRLTASPTPDAEGQGR